MATQQQKGVSGRERARRATQATQEAAEQTDGRAFLESLSDEERESGNKFLAAAEAVNLDEISSPPVKVAIREYRKAPMLDVEGQPVLDDDGHPRYTFVGVSRIAMIETYIPMEVYHLFLDKQEMMRQKGDNAARLEIVKELVLTVWRLTEPDMTMEALSKGLDVFRFMKLYNLFFSTLNRL